MKNYLISVKRFLYDALWNVPMFVLVMIKKLWQNKHKYLYGHWKNAPAWEWLARTNDEVKELKEAMEYEASMFPWAELPKKRLEEAADVANFAMMAGKAKSVD